MSTNSIWLVFNISENINEAKIVAVNGCINKPMEPLDADIFEIPYVLKNCPPNRHKKASKNKFFHSKLVVGNLLPDSRSIGIRAKILQNKVV